jgi:hypothetical protein
MAIAESMDLKGMQDSGECVAWDIQWRAFGPVPYDTPGLREDAETDGVGRMPAELAVGGITYAPVQARSRGGRLDLRCLFGWQPGFPVALLFAGLRSSSRRTLRVRFAADWFTRWWVNGVEVGGSLAGNIVAADDLHFHLVELPLRKGMNLIQVNVGSGVGGWSLRLGVDRRRRRRATGAACAIPRPERRLAPPTRDYTATGLRLEYRGIDPPDSARLDEEPLLRASGVQARWIQLVDHLSNPLYPSRVMPSLPSATEAGKKRLRSWVRRIQAAGMPVLSWHWMCYASEAVKLHPDWASQPFPPGSESQSRLADAHACIHSPYGDALIELACEMVGEFGLDGLWFDGSHFSPMGGVACTCRHCRRKFTAETGLVFPARIDWEDESFRRWLRWRTESFSRYWARLAGAIRRAHPHARVAINHMHRPGIGWPYGCPLAPTGAEIIGGTEGSALDRQSAFITRLVRAAGYQETETWMGLHLLNKEFGGNPCLYMHHAMDCMTAGGMPSFGGDDPVGVSGRAFQALAALVNTRTPWVGGESVPYAALHVSDQSISFRFARIADRDGHSVIPWDAWRSLVGWDHLLADTQCLSDVVLDAGLATGNLARYPVLLLPCSPALSDTNLEVLQQYVEDGGVLVAGPGFGSCDEWGQPSDPSRVKPLLGVRAGAPPERIRASSADTGVRVRHLGRGLVVRLAGDPGARYQELRSRQLASEVAELLRHLAPPVLRTPADPNVRIGLFRRPGALILHVQNGIGYSEMLMPDSSPLLRAPTIRHNVRLRIDRIPVKDVTLVAGESKVPPVVRRGAGHVTITLPELSWGAVLRLDI